MAAVIDADGNLDLAAERSRWAKSALVLAIAENIQEFRRRMAAVTVVQSIADASKLRQRFQQSISGLGEYEATKVYLELQKIVATLVVDKSQDLNININDYTYNRLPRAYQELLVQAETNADFAAELERMARMAAPTAGYLQGETIEQAS